MAIASPAISSTNRHPLVYCADSTSICYLIRRLSADSNLNEVCVPPPSCDLEDFVVNDDLYPPFLRLVALCCDDMIAVCDCMLGVSVY